MTTATNGVGSERITPEDAQEMMDHAGSLMLLELESASEALQRALITEEPRRPVQPWGSAVEALERLIITCVGFRSLGLPVGRPVSRMVLQQLHGRALTTAWEVLTLLRASLPSGALARWRSLHELSVAAAVIANHGEAVAQRYKDHETVRRYRVLSQFREHGDAWEMAPISEASFAKAELKYKQAVATYGKLFVKDNEWARPALPAKNGAITFADLEDAVGGRPWRVKYVVASEVIHVGDSGPRLDDHMWANPYLAMRWLTPYHGLPGAQAAMSIVTSTNALVLGSLSENDQDSSGSAHILLLGLEAMRRKVDEEFTAAETWVLENTRPQDRPT